MTSPQSEKLRTRTLCVRRGLGREPQQARNTPVPHQRFGCVFRVCIYKDIACQYLFRFCSIFFASALSFSLSKSLY